MADQTQNTEEKELEPLTPEQADELMDQMNGKFKGEFDDVVGDAQERLFQQSGLPKTNLGISDSMMEGIYSHAYQMYNRGMYKDGANIFRLLLMLDYSEPKFLMGLAACMHMQESYKAAAQMYNMAAALDRGSPIPYYHAADCFMKLGEPFDAQQMLRFAIREAGDKAEFSVLKERAKLMIESLEPEVEKQAAELKAKQAGEEAAEGKEAKAEAKPKTTKKKKKR